MAESPNGRRPLADLIRVKLGEGVMGAGFLFFSATLLILGVQVFFYLKSGAWPKWVLFELINSALPIPFIEWLAYPQDWHGLHKIVAWILLEGPLVLDIMALSFICIFGGGKIAED